jgi:hypothetical protein
MVTWYRANRLWGDKYQQLKQPLGRWLLPAHLLRREWHSYHDPVHDDIYLTDSSGNIRIHP